MSVINRRAAFKHILAGSAALVSTSVLSSFNSPGKDKTVRLKGNINHSVCRWTYNKLSVDELCKTTKDIGFAAIDLVGLKDWPTLQQYGVFSSMCNGATGFQGYIVQEFIPAAEDKINSLRKAIALCDI